MQTPPEDSIFSMPIWRRGFRDPNASRVQMNPATAYSQGDANVSYQTPVLAVSMLVVMLVIIGGSMYSADTRQQASVQASFDLKHALVGTITGVNENDNSVSIEYSSSQDPVFSSAQSAFWRVQLPPGERLGTKADSKIRVCYVTDVITRNFDKAKPVSCTAVLKKGAKAIVEYLILKKDTQSMVAKKIIVEQAP